MTSENSVSPSPEWGLGTDIYFCHARFYATVNPYVAACHRLPRKTYLIYILPLLEYELPSVAPISPGHSTCLPPNTCLLKE